ncbi:MAG: MerR family transcriptional regulator [Caldilineales bacterium]
MSEINGNSRNASEEPIYNIGVVARMTGIPVATLRVWERRYDFPDAGRTAGGHRLYSENEVSRLRWVKSTIDEGMQTSQAIKALRKHERDGRILSLEASIPSSSTQPVRERANLDVYHKHLIDALINNELDKADQLLGEVLALYSMDQLILEVIGPALADLGEAWSAGKITVATEHLASAFLRQRLIMWQSVGPSTHPIRPVVLSCAPDEWHEISLLMLGVLLRRRRWPVAYLGQAVPLPDLAKFVRDIRPPVVIVVAMTEKPAKELLQLSKWLPEVARTGRPVITYGGRAFNVKPELREKMIGTFLGETLLEGVDTVERMLRETTALTA